jgi:hypothetical protein
VCVALRYCACTRIDADEHIGINPQTCFRQHRVLASERDHSPLSQTEHRPPIRCSASALPQLRGKLSYQSRAGLVSGCPDWRHSAGGVSGPWPQCAALRPMSTNDGDADNSGRGSDNGDSAIEGGNIRRRSGDSRRSSSDDKRVDIRSRNEGNRNSDGDGGDRSRPISGPPRCPRRRPSPSHRVPRHDLPSVIISMNAIAVSRVVEIRAFMECSVISDLSNSMPSEAAPVALRTVAGRFHFSNRSV